jgi:UDP-N-acetylmuramate: L-alanyl-gamma-D-glutamyl-meso-diaminopimelate ligase
MEELNNIHLIAIGGSAMHNVALELHALGKNVTGSDDQVFDPSRSRLEKAGILPDEMGWFPEKITSDLDCIILGMHAKPDNPELKRAQELEIPIYSYPEFLFQMYAQKKRVVIGGSHGKTTTTSMILHILNKMLSKEKIDYMVGAQLKGFDRMVKISKEAEWVVLEGDEYLSSPIDRRSKFLWYKPQIAVLTGIAWDHINVFPTFDEYLDTFRAFIKTIEPNGVLIYNESDEELKKIVESSDHPIQKIPYQTPKYTITNGVTSIFNHQNKEVALEFFGEHNLMNFQAANLVTQNMGIKAEDIYSSITDFTGADKRLTKIHQSENCFVYKDFAHSPSKVQACVKAIKDQFKGFNLQVFLELHTYSSLNKDFVPFYKNSLNGIIKPVLFFSPKALEIKRMSPLEDDFLKESFNQDDLQIVRNAEDFQTELRQRCLDCKGKPSVFLFMSSGNYGGTDLVSYFEK